MKTEVWADTNIIITYLTNDPPAMAQQVLKLMAKAESGSVVIKLNPVIVAECCWVLESAYEHRPAQIAQSFGDLLRADGIHAEEKNELLDALELYRTQNVDFIDAYISTHAQSIGPDRVCTFNAKHFRRLGVTHILPEEVEGPNEVEREPGQS